MLTSTRMTWLISAKFKLLRKFSRTQLGVRCARARLRAQATSKVAMSTDRAALCAPSLSDPAWNAQHGFGPGCSDPSKGERARCRGLIALAEPFDRIGPPTDLDAPGTDGLTRRESTEHVWRRKRIIGIG